MRANTVRSPIRLSWLCFLTVVVLAASCGDASPTPAVPTSQPAPSLAPDVSASSIDEEAEQIQAISYGHVEGVLSSAAAFDDAGLRQIRNDLDAWFNGGNLNTDIRDVDWATEFVLMTVADACRPSAAYLAISVHEFRIHMPQGEWDCESLSPHAALFIVPRNVETIEGAVTFSPESFPDLVGGEPIEVIPSPQLGGFTPVGVFVERDDRAGDRPDERAFFFDVGGDSAALVVGQIVGVGEDEDSYPPGLQAQLDAVNASEEFVLVVAQSSCDPRAFELTPAEGGFTHTMWREPIDCAWAPLHAIVYVVPRFSDDGTEFTDENQPEIFYEFIED